MKPITLIKHFKLITLVFVLVLSYSCKDDEETPEASQDYFPLDLGNYWVYGEDLNSDQIISDEEKLTNTVINSDYLIKGISYSMIETTDSFGNRLDTLYVRRQGTDYIVYAEDFLEFSADISQAESEVTLLMSNKSIGDTWNYNFVLNSIEFDGELIEGIAVDVEVVFELIQKEISLTTQAGTFNDVIAVEQSINLPFLLDDFESFLPITRFYFAPEVGIILTETDLVVNEDTGETETSQNELIEYSLN
ncbi:hypothetical protein OO013_13340 [Mangrovivirga sp. M17]|uniref:Lipid-binding hydrolase n=1 Tax=Mangrovivirga halotolerans TaxID=2993936 RepID=A0ABT3RUD6_9BACT|nr:hypothetical protein [Mangrovivirga halotolerans]MCX2744862.1 hypothetical protein [Mangrovivirga halotolerans]